MVESLATTMHSRPSMRADAGDQCRRHGWRRHTCHWRRAAKARETASPDRSASSPGRAVAACRARGGVRARAPGPRQRPLRAAAGARRQARACAPHWRENPAPAVSMPEARIAMIFLPRQEAALSGVRTQCRWRRARAGSLGVDEPAIFLEHGNNSWSPQCEHSSRAAEHEQVHHAKRPDRNRPAWKWLTTGEANAVRLVRLKIKTSFNEAFKPSMK